MPGVGPGVFQTSRGPDLGRERAPAFLASLRLPTCPRAPGRRPPPFGAAAVRQNGHVWAREGKAGAGPLRAVGSPSPAYLAQGATPLSSPLPSMLPLASVDLRLAQTEPGSAFVQTYTTTLSPTGPGEQWAAPRWGLGSRKALFPQGLWRPQSRARGLLPFSAPPVASVRPAATPAAVPRPYQERPSWCERLISSLPSDLTVLQPLGQP